VKKEYWRRRMEIMKEDRQFLRWCKDHGIDPSEDLDKTYDLFEAFDAGRSEGL